MAKRVILCRPSHCPWCENHSQNLIGKFCVIFGGESQKLKLIKIDKLPIQGITPHIFALDAINQDDKTVKIYVTCGVCGFKIEDTGEVNESGTPLYNVDAKKADMRIIPISEWNAIVLFKDKDYIIAKKIVR